MFNQIVQKNIVSNAMLHHEYIPLWEYVVSIQFSSLKTLISLNYKRTHLSFKSKSKINFYYIKHNLAKTS